MDLKPCPFCGCVVRLVEQELPDRVMGRRTWYMIEGNHTGIGQVCPGQISGRGSAETAIAAWNTRAPDPDQQTTITSLRARVAELEGYISEQVDHVKTRIADGIEMGAIVWRITLEDIIAENRTALKTQGQQP